MMLSRKWFQQSMKLLNTSTAATPVATHSTVQPVTSTHVFGYSPALVTQGDASSDLLTK